jgi:hypothetical protein
MAEKSIEHKITEDKLLAIEQAAGIVTRKDERLTDRLERIIAELELIRQKSNLATNADVAEFKQATLLESIKHKLSVFFNK